MPFAFLPMEFAEAYSGEELKWTNDFRKALKDAAKKEKLIFAFFSGSDWCPHCQRFHKNILINKKFVDAVKDKFIFFNADFPREESLPPEIIEQNEDLSNIYNVEVFPTVILIDEQGSQVAFLPHNSEITVGEYVDILKEKAKAVK